MVADIILIVTAVAGLGGTIVMLLKVKTEKRKLGADAAQVLSQSAIGLLEPMNKQVDVLEARLDFCNAQIDTLNAHLRTAHIELEQTRRENRELRNQVQDLMEEVRQHRKDTRNESS